jgi:hypothetical protein
MRFDWYAATVPVAPTVLMNALSGGLEVVTAKSGIGRHGYAERVELFTQGGDLAATMLSGGNGHPHAYASGLRTDAFVALLRGLWPGHRVTRMDSCEDYETPGCFDKLTAAALELADRLRLKVSMVGDWHRGIDGRTLYVGSPTSPVRLRIYEKGIQVRQGLPEGARECIPVDWVRVELQVRPQRESKALAALASPEAAWGYAAWSQELVGVLAGLEVPRVSTMQWHPSDYERAYRFMVKQFGATIRQGVELHGSWEAFAATLRDDVEEDGRRKRRGQ